jgi:hypothetical protein
VRLTFCSYKQCKCPCPDNSGMRILVDRELLCYFFLRLFPTVLACVEDPNSFSADPDSAKNLNADLDANSNLDP